MDMALASSFRRAAVSGAAVRRCAFLSPVVSRTHFFSSTATTCAAGLRLSLAARKWTSPLLQSGASRPLSSFALGSVSVQEEPQETFQQQAFCSVAPSGSTSAAMDEHLKCIYSAMGLQDYLPGEHISVTGKTITWGIPSEWNMQWCMDGRFYEKFTNEEITQEWGHDKRSSTWYADVGGRVLRLEMDEGEACLLTAWIRTGYWVTEEAQTALEIQHHAATSNASELVFDVRLKNKDVVAQTVIDKHTWLPKRMCFPRFRQGRGWTFSDWQRIMPNRSIRLPMLSVRSSSATTQETFRIVEVTASSTVNDSAYTFPDTLILPRHNHRYPRAEFNKSCSPYVQMTKSRTGHYVVRPLIDGKEVGYFIVDTGTGTLAITQRKARQLGLSTFGEVHATSISGGQVLTTRFSRGSSFEVGRLKIKDPIFVQVGIDKLLKDADGLCGFEIFHGSIVEMSHIDRTLSLYDPVEYKASPRGCNIRWQRMYLYDRVPHILAKINGREALLMLDTGAAGPGLMFPNTAVQGFDNNQSADVPAALGRGGRTLYVSQAEYGNVQAFEIAGCSFTDLTALVPNKSGQQMGLSGYCAGVICAEMLKHFIIVFDYANRRIAFLDQRHRRTNARNT